VGSGPAGLLKQVPRKRGIAVAAVLRDLLLVLGLMALNGGAVVAVGYVAAPRANGLHQQDPRRFLALSLRDVILTALVVMTCTAVIAVLRLEHVVSGSAFLVLNFGGYLAGVQGILFGQRAGWIRVPWVASGIVALTVGVFAPISMLIMKGAYEPADMLVTTTSMAIAGSGTAIILWLRGGFTQPFD
jgi:hypothetical protein